MGSFEDWDACVRGALVWLGCADPADTRKAILDADPRKSDLVEVMELWAQHPGLDEFYELNALEHASRQPDCAVHVVDKLTEVACRGGRWSSRSVGRWLAGHKDRVVNGRYFTCRMNANHTLQWALVNAVTLKDAVLLGGASQLPLSRGTGE